VIRADRREGKTDVTNLIGAFRIYVNACEKKAKAPGKFVKLINFQNAAI
jgi:hypothetical protein